MAARALFWWIAILTMTVANVVALVQTNVKRMLAYSSIAHGGYLLVALVAANEIAKASILFYLLVYAVTNLAAFAVIAALGKADLFRTHEVPRTLAVLRTLSCC